MRYEGEHLLIGQIGHFFALLALVASIVATIAYYKSAQSLDLTETMAWKKMGKISFFIQVFSVLALFVILYLIIYNHYFEYKYAHQHSKRSLDVQYLLSCFWEGQEGSFMLWSFWQCHARTGGYAYRQKMGSACNDFHQSCPGFPGFFSDGHLFLRHPDWNQSFCIDAE